MPFDQVNGSQNDFIGDRIWMRLVPGLQEQPDDPQLRKQLRQAELEREILKKATAYFAKESQ